jgi:hypothetical protein
VVSDTVRTRDRCVRKDQSVFLCSQHKKVIYEADKLPNYRGMAVLKNNTFLLLRGDWSVMADCTVFTVPIDDGLIVLGIRDGCDPVCKLQSLILGHFYSL